MLDRLSGGQKRSRAELIFFCALLTERFPPPLFFWGLVFFFWVVSFKARDLVSSPGQRCSPISQGEVLFPGGGGTVFMH